MYANIAPENFDSLNDAANAWQRVAELAQERARTAAMIALYNELAERGVASFALFDSPAAGLLAYDVDGAIVELDEIDAVLIKKLVSVSDLHAWIAGDVFWAGDSGCTPFDGVHTGESPTIVKLKESPEDLVGQVFGDVPVRRVMYALKRITR